MPSTHRPVRPRRQQKPAARPADRLIDNGRGGKTLALRARLGLTREAFGRLVATSTRTLAAVEAGRPPAEPLRRRLIELGRIVEALAEVVAPDAVGEWLVRPNEAFDGFKPVELIERGHADRIWRMIFLLQTGSPG